MHEQNDDDNDDDGDDNDNNDDENDDDDDDNDLMEFLHSHHLQTSSNREKMNRPHVTVLVLVVQG